MECWHLGKLALWLVGAEELWRKVLRILYKLLPKLDGSQLDVVIKLLHEPMASHDSDECRAWYFRIKGACICIYLSLYIPHVYVHFCP